MEVVALSGNNNGPFKREVHEWQHIDAKTGALLSGRAEQNRYVNGNLNSYGKVSCHNHFFLNSILSLLSLNNFPWHYCVDISTELIKKIKFTFCASHNQFWH